MNRRLIFTGLFISFLTLSDSTSGMISENDLKKKLIGIWLWQTVFDSETGEDMGIQEVTMGMATEVKTEFRMDHIYVESKLRKGSSEYSTTEGEWRLENNKVLAMKSKEKWSSVNILKLSEDSLLLEINPKMNLLMIKQP